MTDRRIISTPNAPGAIGPYNQAVVAGGFVHCSGQIALDPKSGEMIGDEIVCQAEQVFRNLGAVLEAAGSSFERAIKCNVWVADMDDFAALNEVYARYFPAETAPARATVAVRTLPKNALVEIDCLALV